MKDILRKFAVTMARPFLKRAARSSIENYKDEVLAYIQEKVDIPKLDEAEEAKAYEAIYDVVAASLDKIIDRM